jgi:hypothetical protein
MDERRGPSPGSSSDRARGRRGLDEDILPVDDGMDEEFDDELEEGHETPVSPMDEAVRGHVAPHRPRRPLSDSDRERSDAEAGRPVQLDPDPGR